MKKLMLVFFMSSLLLFTFTSISHAGGSWYTNGQSGSVSDSDLPTPTPAPANPPSTSTDTYHHTPKCVSYRCTHWVNEQFQCGSTRKCWKSDAGIICEDVPKYCTKKVCVSRECVNWE
ncbi:hypothetical protein Hipma_0401 [Hippea maritima DSM 10411]|uniref:Uncharacterized protein n=1 Tax=Hippea maritima (strain ATCC 700847 / DSM 10411 / MH2) TaxID=760142 RepID=F2LTX5_HIPMA|nr:hypothetical protein Hipma_0401 [Hippea maritima DSM 10411]